MNFLIATCAFLGSGLQMLLALVEAREAHRDAMQTAKAEQALVVEQPRRRRRRVRKELRSWRDAQTERSLAYLDALVFSWALLMAAAFAGIVQSL